MPKNKDSFEKPRLELKYYILMEMHGREYLEDLLLKYEDTEPYEDCTAIMKVLLD